MPKQLALLLLIPILFGVFLGVIYYPSHLIASAICLAVILAAINTYYDRWAKNTHHHDHHNEEEIIEDEEDEIMHKPLSDDDRKRTLIHEAGHLIVLWFSPLFPEFKSCTISFFETKNEAGENGNVAETYVHDFSYMTRDALIQEIAFHYGGMIAEEIFGYERARGNRTDIKTATDIATKLVFLYGMGDKYTLHSSPPQHFSNLSQVPKQTQNVLYKQRVDVLQDGYNRAQKIIKSKTKEIEDIVRTMETAFQQSESGNISIELDQLTKILGPRSTK